MVLIFIYLEGIKMIIFFFFGPIPYARDLPLGDTVLLVLSLEPFKVLVT